MSLRPVIVLSVFAAFAALAADPKPATAWSWAGCSKSIDRGLVFTCPDARLQLGKVAHATKPTGEDLQKAERELLSRSVANLLAGFKLSVKPELSSATIHVRGQALEHSAALIPETERTQSIALRAVALPSSTGESHFVVLYSCTAKEDRHCAAA